MGKGGRFSLMEWNKIVQGDCIELLREFPDKSVNLVATDPPFNIGLKGYDTYKDKIGYEEYKSWCRSWLQEVYRVLVDNGSVWVCIGDEYAAEVNILLKECGFHYRSWCIWYYTFGENQKKKFNRCKTHLLYFTKSSTEWIWNGDDIKVPSARQLKYKDKRAKAGGKIPDDIWEFANTESSSTEPDDIWKISRVCGSFHERIKDEDGTAHPCQLPLELTDRVIKASSNVGDVVVDLFCGTGTFVYSAKSLGRQFWSCDISEKYVNVALKRLFG